MSENDEYTLAEVLIMCEVYETGLVDYKPAKADMCLAKEIIALKNEIEYLYERLNRGS